MQHIDRELRENRYPNCFQVARMFNVSRKSIQRDIDFLRYQLGAPIDYDPRRKGYFYTQEWSFDPMHLLDEEESESLASVCRMLARYRGSPFYDEVCRAIEKLVHASSPEPAGEEHPGHIAYVTPETGLFDQAVLPLLEEAIRGRRKVIVTYRSLSNRNLTETRLRPYRLHYCQFSGSWHLIAWCETLHETLSFPVCWIQELKQTGERFSIPSLFSVSNSMETGVLEGLPVQREVSIRFSSAQSRWIREHPWNSGHMIEEHDDGSLTLRLGVSSLDAVKRWVLQYGAQAEVLEPPELREMLMSEAREMLKAYTDGVKKRKAGSPGDRGGR
jgi:predicted DNA-binding transcriptional regulator YafY